MNIYLSLKYSNNLIGSVRNKSKLAKLRIKFLSNKQKFINCARIQIQQLRPFVVCCCTLNNTRLCDEHLFDKLAHTALKEVSCPRFGRHGLRDVMSNSSHIRQYFWTLQFLEDIGGSAIQTSLDFQWSQRSWVANGLNFEWNPKSASPTIRNI